MHLIFCAALAFVFCSESSESRNVIPYNLTSDTLKYTNPVFEPVLADPTVVKVGEEFYAYGTEDNWGNEGGYRLVPVIKSKDLINWKLVGNAMSTKPDWKEKGGIWAPDVTQVKDQFYMYYSFSTWGDVNPGIGLAIADKPEGPFIDHGKVFDSEEIGVKNSIDPFYMEKDGKRYLMWGSFHGIFLTELTADGRKPTGEKVQVAGNHLEAPYVYEKDGYYYLFGSTGTCCAGAKSSYRILVGRSEMLEGPYVDKYGKSMRDYDSGTLVVGTNASTNGYAGPGHNAEIVTDAEGQDWLLYHGMSKEKPKLNNGTNRRVLLLDKIIWTSGWPSIACEEPSMSSQKSPSWQKNQ
ncbi:arabinan endo-1,5-alpha-L-arabinosidase [Algoriphagus ratkowskyi]|uniref:Arabinan endo-1,5-alpha-L-arabinosidase n=1 Tax=Algoriphagus ratkowskyi TaxID=57028 RepID=A0A2W7RGJ7_9BACT|nr:family 43 glycosylhydrolase [Algoriphagus ratkowskyi]PZX58226.1 arabinan endo-1,5-alpha-L-arabinosidase [Algoriphagus ratkowskyi]TXD77892.1 family 43 glycosylhydrolase [Algoriphagus ratkowskyi]